VGGRGAIGKRLVSQESWSSVSSEFCDSHEVHGTAMSSLDLGSRIFAESTETESKLYAPIHQVNLTKTIQKPDQRKTALTDTAREIYKIRFTNHLSFTAYNGNH